MARLALLFTTALALAASTAAAAAGVAQAAAATTSSSGPPPPASPTLSTLASPALPTLASPLLPQQQGAGAVSPPASTGSPSTGGPSPLINTTKRRVVLHQDHGHKHLPHHHSPWEIEMGLVVALVVVHFLALCFWMYLLYSTKDRKRAAKAAKWGITTRSGAGAASQGGASPDASASKYSKAGRSTQSKGGAAEGASAWRTPGEILATWNKAVEKQRLGKV